MSSLKPPFDQSGARREQAQAQAERQEPASAPRRSNSTKRLHSERNTSPDVHEPAVKQAHSREQLSASRQMTKLTLETPAATKAVSVARPPTHDQQAAQHLACFETLAHPKSAAELRQLMQKLSPLLEDAEGFKLFSAVLPDGSRYGMAHVESDAKSPKPSQHVQLAYRLMMLLMRRTKDKAVRETVKKLATIAEEEPAGFARAGSRLFRHNGRFELAPSTTFGLPRPEDPNYDDYVQVHANMLRALGGKEIVAQGSAYDAPPTPPPSTPGSDGDTPEPLASGPVEAMCAAINARLAKSAELES